MKILPIIIGIAYMATSAAVMAVDTKTVMDKNWTCTTNASSSSVDADKNADDQMEKTTQSASAAFSFAASHCRDCTKITCKAK